MENDFNYDDIIKKSSDDSNNDNPIPRIEYVPEEQNKTPQKGYAIASLVLGIVSIVCCCCGTYVPMILSVLAIVFFFVDKKRNGVANGMAIAGLVCGIFSLLISVTGLIISSTDFYNNLMADYQSILDSMMADIEAVE